MTTAYGRVKTKGQSTVKEFESPKAAKTAAEKLIAQKLKKGYTQTGGPRTKPKAKPATKKTAKKKAARKTPKKKVDVSKLGESAALKLAKSPDTSKTDLKKLAGRFDRVDRALAKRDDLSATLIEDPACFHQVDEEILVRLLKQDSCPEALVQYGLQLGQQSDLSEGQAAVFLLASARRLEEKYPELKELGSWAPAIQPKYEAICEEVEPHLADRKGSGLGRLPFLSKRFPMLRHRVPMLQLDLDEASRVTNEDLGHGLLQVWDPDCIRIIPRHVVKATKHLLDVPADKSVMELFKKISEEPERVGETEYWEKLCEAQGDGYIWNDPDLLGIGSEPPIQALQITGWKAAGYLLPSQDFWGDEAPQRVYDDPMYHAMSKVQNDELPSWSEGCLFGIAHYVQEFHICPPWDKLGWRPLFAFRGPTGHGGVTVDDNTVFFRQTPKGFEYQHVREMFT